MPLSPFGVLRAVSLSNGKEHMAIDADSEFVTAVSVTPGNVADSQMLEPLIDLHGREVTADKGLRWGLR